MNPLFTILVQLPSPPLPSPWPLPPSPPVGSATPPSQAPHPSDYCAFGIVAIGAATLLQWPLLFQSPLPPRVAVRPATFPAAITVVVILVLQAFWICPHYLHRSLLNFHVFFISLSSIASSAVTAVASSTVVVVQAAPVPPSTMYLTSSDTSGPPAIFNEFLKWYENRQNSYSTTSVAHTGISFVGLTYSNSLDSWVLDSGAPYHITGNKFFFSSLSTSSHLPSITMANGSKVSSHGIGTIHLCLSLSINNVFYVPGSPFKLLSVSRLTRSLDCVVSFTKDSVCLQY